jgi:Zn ribbon nucleic-acid-binding protein
MRNLRNLSQLNIPLPTDEEGYLGRKCPNKDCKGYFKIVLGTGLKGVTVCHCPYCGHTAEQSDFTTQDQIEYAKSIAIRKISDAVVKDLKSLEFDVKSKGAFGIGLSLKVKPGQPHPIHWYREKALETHIECSKCTLRYAVFGVFAFCPDCRQHNSLQILGKNLEIVVKMLDVASSADPELGERLVENALEDCVSAFDGFAREICRVNAQASSHPDEVLRISFQNLAGAQQKVSTFFRLDLAAGLTEDEWATAVRAFQKRHLLAHKMGVADKEYVRKSGDAGAIVGRKIKIDANEVRQLVQIISKLAEYFVNALRIPRNEP